MVRAGGDVLSTGLGRPRSFVTYIPGHGNPPYFSVLDESAGEEEVRFDFSGEPTDYLARNTVPFAVALDVACRFAAEAGLPLPGLVAWEEV